MSRSLTHSFGRFFSIFGLMAIGSFALVGLKVTSPDMKETSTHYFEQLHLADLSVISDYGLNKDDQKLLNQTKGIDKIEYGYLKDAVIKDTTKSIRIFSTPHDISKPELVSGMLPSKNDEIAISSNYQEKYAIGDKIVFWEKADSAGNKVLTRHSFKVVGYVNTPEIISTNMGQTTAGSGKLEGYAFVNSDVFDSDVYMMARITYKDTQGINPYSEEYSDIIQTHKEELETLLQDQPSIRLAAIKQEAQEEIDSVQRKIDDAKSELNDAKKQLNDAKKQLNDGKKEIATKQKELDETVEKAEQQLTDAEQQIKTTESSMNKQIEEKEQELQLKQTEYQQKITILNDKKQEVSKSEASIKAAQLELDTKKEQLEEGKTKYQEGIDSLNQTILEINQQLQNSDITEEESVALSQQLTTLQKQLLEIQTEQTQFLKETYEPGIAKITSSQIEINQKKEELASAKKTIAKNEQQLAAAKQQLDSAKKQIEEAKSQGEEQLSSKKSELAAARTELDTQKINGESQLEEAKQTLAKKQQEYNEKLKEYEEKELEANKEIKAKEKELQDAQNTLDSLEKPVYSISSRRETPGSDGYKIYNTVANIIESLANIFPIFLYFIAALVTFTTMTRFVDEERTNSGTLKALGYSDKDIWSKFTNYGLCASLSGSTIGIILGHITLPLIAYNAYADDFILPKIELHFHLGITIIALILSFVSAVVPAYLVAIRELQEKPSLLLLPKAPVSGSKIWLQYITPVWNRMSFTHKVTARNIFRYKKRMFMTIFGVCGSVALLFTGFSVKNSISGINERQFGNIIQYDLIALKNSNLSTNEEKSIDSLLQSDKIKQHTSIYFEEMSIVAGKNHDKQTINLIATNKEDQLKDYIHLFDRKSQQSLDLHEDGVIISERLAKLLSVESGDTIEVQNKNGDTIKMQVHGITEMYMGHFIFMNQKTYEKIYQKSYEANGYLVNLKESTISNTEKVAATFMNNSGIQGVVQNTGIKTQIDSIVESLNTIMGVLIIVATLLAIVILYNLTNINVSERIRELSTIKVLGFYNNEVTLYIYRETIILSLLGILVGYGAGILLHSYIINSVAPDNVMFNPALHSNSFFIPTLIILFILVILGFLVNKRLKNVDMLEALKSVE